MDNPKVLFRGGEERSMAVRETCWGALSWEVTWESLSGVL